MHGDMADGVAEIVFDGAEHHILDMVYPEKTDRIWKKLIVQSGVSGGTE